jgi:class 3 adenylate cyclase
MAQLTANTRAQLRNAAFAYIDSKGRRRLPIHDEAHVRNAVARFNQTKFEDDAARERARKKLLSAAKKYGIVPIGFITGQLATERLQGESTARAGVVRGLPSGQVTFLLTDIEDSTGLLRVLEDGYANLLDDVRRLLRRAVQRSGGKEVDVRADELFAIFKRPSGALAAALAIQRRAASRSWPRGAKVRLRIGIHTGRPTLTDGGYVGLAVHTAARICSAGHGGQILLSIDSVRAIKASASHNVSFRNLGSHLLQGLPNPQTLFQLEAPDLPSNFPAPRIANQVLLRGPRSPARRSSRASGGAMQR